MLLAKKDKDEHVLLAEDQAWMESSNDSDQEINANMVFMAQLEKVLSDSKASSSSADEKISEMSRDVLTVGSTMRIPLLYRGEYSQWVERFMHYLEEQTDGESMINSIKNGDQPLPRVTQVSIAGTTSTEQPLLKDKSMWHMLGSEYGEQDRKAAVLYEYETFKATEIQNQGDVNDAMGSKKKTVVVTSYPLALIVEKTNVSRSKEKVIVSSDSKGSETDDFNELKKITALLAKAFNRRKFYSKPTNNNLRTSSSYQVKCYNCKKEAHFAKDCKKAKEINANMVFMAQIKKVLSDSEASSSSADEKISKIDLEHTNKVLSMQDEESEPTDIQEVVEVVTTAKLITEVVTAASETITAADTLIHAATITVAASTLTTAPSAARRRNEVVIRDPEEIVSKPSIIIHTEPKSKDKGKGIMVHEPKPLKKKTQIEQDEAFARELEAELNKNIDWDAVLDQVKRKKKEDNDVMRYQALKKKPQTDAQARKNIMIYLRNMAGFKMDYFRGMSYDDISSIFEKYFNSNLAFLEKTKEQMDKEDSKALKRISESHEDKAAKRQKLDEEVLVVDYEIYNEHNKPYYKIKRAEARCTSSNLEKSKKCSWLSEGQELEAVRVLWCADHYIYYNTVDLLVERKYLHIRFTWDQMFNNVRLEVEEESKVSLELLIFTRQQQQEGFIQE
nr:hypothetical protein [Tanacetum cinerariifolium]